jgi:hypothetical protein
MHCEECGDEPDVEAHAAGWVAYLVDLADDPGAPEVVTFCPDCREREFAASKPHWKQD